MQYTNKPPLKNALFPQSLHHYACDLFQRITILGISYKDPQFITLKDTGKRAPFPIRTRSSNYLPPRRLNLRFHSMMSLMQIHNRRPPRTTPRRHQMLAPRTLDHSIQLRLFRLHLPRFALPITGTSTIKKDSIATDTIPIPIAAALLTSRRHSNVPTQHLRCRHGSVELTWQIMPEFAFTADDE